MATFTTGSLPNLRVDQGRKPKLPAPRLAPERLRKGFGVTVTVRRAKRGR